MNPGAYQAWTNECGTPISEPQKCKDILSYKKEQLNVSQANLFAALKKYLFGCSDSLKLVEKYKNEVNKIKTDIQLLGEQ
jgi:hypothetical protein